MGECLFCKIVAGAIPAKVVWEDEHALAFHDIHPAAPVHVIIIPKRHAEGFGDLDDPAFMASLAVGLRAVAEAEKVSASGYRILCNNGPDAGQEVPHLHLHLVGGRPLGPMLSRHGR